VLFLLLIFDNFYSRSKRSEDNNKQKQKLQHRKKRSTLTSNLDTHLARNTLGKLLTCSVKRSQS